MAGRPHAESSNSNAAWQTTRTSCQVKRSQIFRDRANIADFTFDCKGGIMSPEKDNEGGRTMSLRICRTVVLLQSFVAITASVGGAPVAAAQTFTEFSVRDRFEMVAKIARGPDGALWFTSQNAMLGRITTDGAITSLGYRPVRHAEIVAGPDGALWILEASRSGHDDMVSRITTSGTRTSYSLGKTVPRGIVMGPDDRLWFADKSGIVAISTGGQITRYPQPNHDGIRSLATGPDGAVWFASHGKIGRITPAGATTGYELPAAARLRMNHIWQITAGPDGAMWFTVDAFNNDPPWIGRITMEGVITQFAVADPDPDLYSLRPISIVAGPDGALWFMSGTLVGRMTTAGVISIVVPYQVATPYHTPPDVSEFPTLVVGPDNALWIARIDSIARLVPPATPEGYAAHRIDKAWAAPFKAFGDGIKVCVISTDVRYLAAAQTKGSLGTVSILKVNRVSQDGDIATGNGEGTAMLEIIHRIAPKATLGFATGVPEAALVQNIPALAADGCKIIVDDITNRTGSPFQVDDTIAAVNALATQNVLYFTSAGNFGNLAGGTSQVWEGDFQDSGVPFKIGDKTGTLHVFARDPGPVLFNTLLPGGNTKDLNPDHACRFDQSGRAGGTASLFWNDPLGKSANDYDLVAVSTVDGQPRYWSSAIQDGTQDPYEILPLYPGDAIGIIKKAGAANKYLRLEVQKSGFCRFKYATAGSVRGHNAAENAISVAAVTAGSRAFRWNSKVAQYSSDGPRQMYYDSTGAAAAKLLKKPDLAAADQVYTDVPGYENFWGTSAAAPHAAAIAALVWSYRPQLSAAQVKEALISSAIDIETPGWDNLSGAGIVMAEPALRAAEKLIVP